VPGNREPCIPIFNLTFLNLLSWKKWASVDFIIGFGHSGNLHSIIVSGSGICHYKLDDESSCPGKNLSKLKNQK
jgi:hypothetical protein